MDTRKEDIFKTTPDWFFDWLKNELSPYCGLGAPRPIDVQNDSITLQKPNIDNDQLSIDAHGLVRDKEGIYYVSDWGTVIKFKAVQLSDGPNLSQITGESSNQSSVRGFFNHLWDKIVTQFPKPQIESGGNEIQAQPAGDEGQALPDVPIENLLPERPGDRKKWQRLWKLKINGWCTYQRMDAATVIEKLRDQKRNSQYSGWIPHIETMNKIIDAGLAGKL